MGTIHIRAYPSLKSMQMIFTFQYGYWGGWYALQKDLRSRKGLIKFLKVIYMVDC